MKKPTNFRLSEDALEMLDKLAEYLGLSKTAVLELIIREKYRSTEKEQK